MLKLLIIIPSIVTCVLIAVRIVGRTVEWDRPVCDEHDERLKEIARQGVRNARRRYDVARRIEQYEMN